MLRVTKRAVESAAEQTDSQTDTPSTCWADDAMDEYDLLADQLGDLWHVHRAEFIAPQRPPTPDRPFAPDLMAATQALLEQVLETTFAHVAVPTLPIDERLLSTDDAHHSADSKQSHPSLLDWLASRQELRDIYREKLPGIAEKLLTRLRMAGHLPLDLHYHHPSALSALSPENFRRFLASHKLKDRSPVLPLLGFAEPQPIYEDIGYAAKMFRDYCFAIDRKIEPAKEAQGWVIRELAHDANRTVRRTAIKKICRSLMSRRATPLQPVIKRFRSMEVLQRLSGGTLPEQISRFADAGQHATIFGVLTDPRRHFQGETIRHQIVRTFTNLSLHGGIVKWRVVQRLIGAKDDASPESALRDFIMLAATIPNEEVVPDCALTYQDLLTFLNGGTLK